MIVYEVEEHDLVVSTPPYRSYVVCFFGAM